VAIGENRTSGGRLTSMATLEDEPVRKLLSDPNYAVVSTKNSDGSILSTVVWADIEDGAVAVNSAIGRKWPTNLQRDPHATVLIYEAENPYNYVEIRGKVTPIEGEEADQHINRLTQKYMNQDEYPFRQPGEQRIKFLLKPESVRHMKQG
jgi:PPOX class probable F420-dependent enzyme